MDEFGQQNDKRTITHVPTIAYFESNYGRSTANDKKAVRFFREFESKERLRRLQQELTWLKNGMVTEKVCDSIVGKKRKGKHSTYERWAELMLRWIVESKS